MSNPNNQGSPSKPQSEDHRDPSNPSDSWLLSKVGFQLSRPSPGKYPSRTDEYCFIYCSQSTNGRMQKQEPQCKSYCFRRIFPHEVRKAVAQDNRIAQEHTKHPLPPEGQRADEVPGGNLENDQYERKLREKDAKYWEEGWYLWHSKSRWAAQERLDLMMHDLAVQANWNKHMAKQKRDWEMERKGGRDLGQWEPPSMSIAAPRPPFWDPSKQSLLVRLQPPLPPIVDQMRALFAPTFKLIAMQRESFESGVHRQVVERLWEKTWSGEPFMLARNACVKMWKIWKGDDHDEW